MKPCQRSRAPTLRASATQSGNADTAEAAAGQEQSRMSAVSARSIAAITIQVADVVLRVAARPAVHPREQRVARRCRAAAAAPLTTSEPARRRIARAPEDRERRRRTSASARDPRAPGSATSTRARTPPVCPCARRAGTTNPDPVSGCRTRARSNASGDGRRRRIDNPAGQTRELLVAIAHQLARRVRRRREHDRSGFDGLARRRVHEERAVSR